MPDHDQSSRRVALIGTRGYPSYYGGFETAVRKLAPFLAESGWDVTVYGRDGATRQDDPDRDPRVKTRVTKGVETKSLSTLSYGLTAVLDAAIRKPDVALVMNVAHGFWLPLLKLRGVPTLVNVDGIEWERAKWGTLAKFMFRAGARTTAWWGNRLVYDAKEIARYWKVRFGTDGVFIPYGGEEPGDLPAPDESTHRGYALVVARFVPENTIEEFIRAAEMIGETHDVIIVGSTGYGGELEERVAALAEANPRVTWLGHLSDDKRLLGLWQHAGAYFHGHSVGGTNPALVQAMLCGAPTVARDTVYNREVLDDTAVFVPPVAAAIARAVTDLLQDPEAQERLSVAARERARQHYTWADICRRYEAELESLLEGRPRWVTDQP
ncbi:MAG: glycosyl transferase [Frondihabitans sp.]|nr:glycosyl transferase [Frondihabitans sp.]